jgi:hypothetical protein
MSSFASMALCGVLAAATPDGGRVAQATRVQLPLTLDGRLEEPGWEQAKPLQGFLQEEPNEGEAGSQRSEVRILFDDTGIHFGIQCWDSEPERIQAQLTRRDREPRQPRRRRGRLPLRAERSRGAA